jgi:hypothetical protein
VTSAVTPPARETLAQERLPIATPRAQAVAQPLAALVLPTPTPAMLYLAPCQSATAELLIPYVAAMDAAVREGFRCAIDRPQTLDGEYLPYERGAMLLLPGLEKMFIRYEGIYNGVEAPWQDVDLPLLAPVPLEAPLPPHAPEDLRYNPTQVFARIWQNEPMRTRLGLALRPQSETVRVVAQPFNGGWLILRLATSAEDAALYIYPLTARLF